MWIQRNLLGLTFFFLFIFSGPSNALDFSAYYNQWITHLQNFNPFSNIINQEVSFNDLIKFVNCKSFQNDPPNENISDTITQNVTTVNSNKNDYFIFQNGRPAGWSYRTPIIRSFHELYAPHRRIKVIVFSIENQKQNI